MTKLLIVLIVMNMYSQTNLSNVEDEKYIVGGDDAKIRDFPFMVVLRITKAYKHVSGCGGTYIHPLWVLTAAHCLTITYGFPPKIAKHDAVRMIMGLEREDQKNFQTSFSVKLIVCPLYGNKNSWSLNDIALIKIKSSFKITRDVKIAKLQTREVPRGASVTAIGWGAIKTTDNKTTGTSSKRLQRLDLTVWDATECNEATTNEENVICVGKYGKVPCFGDSGGPLVYQDSVVGVASYGFGCNGRVVVYVAIYNYLSWINSTIVNRGNTQTKTQYNLYVIYVIYIVIIFMFRFS